MNTQETTEMHFDNHQQSIAEVAYLKAEKRGFAQGFHEQDWAEAESEVFSRIIGGCGSNWHDAL